MTTCLTPGEMEGLLANSLSPPEKARAEAHLAECEICRNELHEKWGRDHLFKDIQQSHAETPTRDIEHNLSGERTDAKRDNTWYVIRKSLRQYRVAAGVAVGFVLLLAVSTIALSIMYQDQKRARVEALVSAQKAADEARAAVRARTNAEEQLKLAEQRASDAEATRDDAKRYAEAVRDDAKWHAEAGRARSGLYNYGLHVECAGEEEGKLVNWRRVGDHASKLVDRNFEQRPLVEAYLRTALGHYYRHLRKYGIAARYLERALTLYRTELGVDHLETISALSALAKVYFRQGRVDEAEQPFVEALEARRRVLGEVDRRTLASMIYVAYLYISQNRHDEAESLQVKTIQALHRDLGKDHPATLCTKNDLAILYMNQGRYDDAETLYVDLLAEFRRAFGEDHLQTSIIMTSLADLYRLQGRYDEAEKLHVPALEVKTRSSDGFDCTTMRSTISLGALYYNQGRYGQAESLFLTALDTLPDSIEICSSFGTAHAITNLAHVYVHQGRYDEAERLIVRALKRNRVVSSDGPDTLNSENNLAFLYRLQGRHDAAEALYVEALKQRRSRGHSKSGWFRTFGTLAEVYTRQGAYDDAESLFDETLEKARLDLGTEHRTTLVLMSSLGRLYTSQGRYEEAESVYHTTLEVQRRVMGEGHIETLTTINNLAGLYSKQGRYDEAEALFVKTIEESRRALGSIHIMDNLKYNLPHNYNRGGIHAPAVAAVRGLYTAGNARWLGNYLEELGEVRVRQGKFPAAEKTLLEAYALLSAGFGADYERTFKTVKTLVDLYNAWHAAEPDKGYDKRAGEWRARLPQAVGEVEAATP